MSFSPDTGPGLCAGHVEPGFEGVRAAFEQVIATASGTGSAFAAWYDGRWVADLWGGWADAARTRRWARDTLAMPYSVSKPFAAVCLLRLVDRGDVDLDAFMSRYWPEFSAPATIREVLSHSAGIVHLAEPAPVETFYDWDDFCARLARQAPTWTPGTGLGEASLVYGHLVGEVVRRVDGRDLGTFLREEVCGPAGLDFAFGLALEDLARVVELTSPAPLQDSGATNPSRTALHELAIGNPPGARDLLVVNSSAWRRALIPAVNGHGTARAVGGLFLALAHGEILSPGLVAQMSSVQAEGFDGVVGEQSRWGLGVGIDDDGWGMGGLGGSVGWWSEKGRYAVGFVTGELGGFDRVELVENALRDAIGLPPL